MQGMWTPGAVGGVNATGLRPISRGLKANLRGYAPRAAPNRTNERLANGATHQGAGKEEMLLADLSPPTTSSEDLAGEPLRKVAVPPRVPVPANIIAPVNGNFNGQGRRIPAQAQHVLEQYFPTSGTASVPATNAANAQLVSTQNKLKQQAIELQQAKAELATKNAEIQALKAQAAEREGRLRTARADLMESRALAVERESKLVELYHVLAGASAERARLREELAQTKVELAETVGELESLADEILAMKDIVLNDSELAELDAKLAAEAEGRMDTTVLASEATITATTTISTSATPPTFESMAASTKAAAEGTWEVLQNLAEMSKQLLEDANLDEEAFVGAGFFKKLTAAAQTPNKNTGGER